MSFAEVTLLTIGLLAIGVFIMMKIADWVDKNLR